MPFRIILYLLLIIASQPASGQQLYFRHLTTSEGLLSDLRLVMTEDNHGRMWIGSEEGINVFDGKELFTYSLPDNSGLLTNYIQQIFCDQKNTIWIKGPKGIQYKRESDSKFQTLQTDIEDVGNALFFENGPGNSVFAITGKEIYKISSDFSISKLSGLSHLFTKYRRPLCFYHFGNDTWLIGFGEKVVVVDMRKQRVLNELNYVEAWCMNKTDDSTVMAGSFARSQMALINIYTGEVEDINNWPNNTGLPISGYAGTIAPIGNNQYAIGCRTNGVYIIDVANRSAVHLTHNPADPSTMRSRFCRRLYVTRSRNMFVHTVGVSYTSLNPTQFNTIKKLTNEKGEVYDEGYNSFQSAQDGNMWIATNKQLIYWNRKTNVSNFYPFYNPAEGPLFLKTVRAVVADKNNRIWVGTFGGGIGMLKSDGSYDRIVPDKKNPEHSLPSKEIHGIVKDKDENLIICANRGFAVLDPINRKIENYTTHPKLKHVARNTTFFAMADRENNLWLAQWDGLHYYNKTKDTLINIALPDMPDKAVQALAEDNDGNIYVGSKEGVYIIAHGQYEVTGKLDKKDGLSSQYIMGLVKDTSGHIWILGSKGLARYNLPEKKLEVFNAKDGLEPSNHALCTYHLTPQGEMFIGTSAGFNHFYPDDIKAQRQQLNVFISSIELQDTVINFPSKDLLDLKYFENNITFNYQAVDYNLAPYIQYRYRMQGFDTAYVYAGSERKARYTNMPAGNYIFTAEASINGKDWQVAAPSVTIYIRKALWKTGWFQLSIALLLAGSLYAWYRYRIQAINRSAAKRTAYEVKLNEMENSALRTQMNPHFIFNSLNTINAFINANDSAQANQYISKFSKLVRLILDHSRLKRISLSEEIDSLKLYIQIEQIRFENKFDWSIVVDPAIDPSITEIPSLIIQPFVENAILHGLLPLQGKGILSVTWLRKGNYMLCTIEDNGIGRQQAMVDKKHSPTQRKSHGLDITLKRIEFFNKEHGIDMEAVVTDLYHTDGTPAGTRVEVYLACVERF